MENNYKSTITYSITPLSVKEKINYKDLTGAYRIDKVLDSVEGETVKLESLQQYVEISVHNDASKNPDYMVYLFEFANGERYVTSSPSAHRSFFDIVEELEEAGEEVLGCDFTFSRRPSKTQTNGFLICNLA